MQRPIIPRLITHDTEAVAAAVRAGPLMAVAVAVAIAVARSGVQGAGVGGDGRCGRVHLEGAGSHTGVVVDFGRDRGGRGVGRGAEVLEFGWRGVGGPVAAVVASEGGGGERAVVRPVGVDVGDGGLGDGLDGAGEVGARGPVRSWLLERD